MTQPQAQRCLAPARQSPHQCLRQGRGIAAPEGLLESRHERGHRSRVRRALEQGGGLEQVLLPTLGRTPAHDPRQQGLPHEGMLPERVGFPEIEDGRAGRGPVRLQNPPAQQRHTGVGDILVMGGQRGHQRQRPTGREPSGRCGHLGAHTHLGLARNAAQPGLEQRAAQVPRISDQPHRPFADQRRGMVDEPGGQGLVEPTRLMQGPQGGDGRLIGQDAGLESRDQVRTHPLGQDPSRHQPMPSIGMGQRGQQRLRSLVIQAHVLHQRLIGAPQAIQATGRRIDLALVVLPVGDVVLVEIGDAHRPVRSIGQIHRPKGFVAAVQHRSQVARAEGGPDPMTVGGQHHVVQRIEPEQLTLPGGRQRRPFHHRQDVSEPLERSGRSHPGQLTIGVRVARRPELAGVGPLLEVVAALLVMPAAGLGSIVAAEEPSVAIQLEPEDIPAALGEQLVLPGHRMIAPDHATLEMDARRALRIESRPHHAAGGGAALPSVDPPIGAPDQSIGHGMGVLQAEAGEVDDRRTIGHVVAIGVGKEEQVGRVHDPHPAAPRQHGVGHVEPVHEHPMTIGQPVAIGVFMDGDPVAARCVSRRRLGHSVVLGPVVLVATEHLGTGRIGILPVLGHPKPTPGVEAEVRGLGHLGLVQQQVHAEVGRRFHEGHRLGRGLLGPGHELRCLGQHPVRFVVLVEGGAGRSFSTGASGIRHLGGRNGPPVPDALEDRLVEVIHHERSLALESAPTLGMVGPDEEGVPLALLQQAGRDLVPVTARDPVLIVRWKGASPPDQDPIDPHLVGPGEPPQMKGNRLGEEVALMGREETVMRLEPGPVGTPGRHRLSGPNGNRPRHGDRLPRIQPTLGRQRSPDSEEKATDQEHRKHTGHDGSNLVGFHTGTAAQKHRGRWPQKPRRRPRYPGGTPPNPPSEPDRARRRGVQGAFGRDTESGARRKAIRSARSWSWSPSSKPSGIRLRPVARISRISDRVHDESGLPG